jgi:hypothetical protein
MTDGSDDHELARDMIDVHGKQAAAVARQNARATALAGQAEKAKSWIRVLGTIQRQQAGKVPPQRPVASADATDDLSDDNAVSREPCPGPAGLEGIHQPLRPFVRNIRSRPVENG